MKNILKDSSDLSKRFRLLKLTVALDNKHILEIIIVDYLHNIPESEEVKSSTMTSIPDTQGSFDHSHN